MRRSLHALLSTCVARNSPNQLPRRSCLSLPRSTSAACQDAGCVNLATALALLLGDEPSLQRFATENPAVWADLHRLIANDVHLCGFAPVLSPLPSPVVASVAAGGSSVGAGQA